MRTRKKPRKLALRKAYVQKQKVQRGEQHISRSGKIIAGKTFAAQLNCGCMRKCANEIDVVRQKEIFDDFYAIPNWTQKTLFLRSLATKKAVKVNLNAIQCEKNRKCSLDYFLTDLGGIQHQVCLAFLLNCLQITKHRILRVMQSSASNAKSTDRRGTERPTLLILSS